MEPGAWRGTSLFLATVVQGVNGLLTVALLVRVARTSLPAADARQLYLQDADRASAMCNSLGLPAWSAFFLLQQIRDQATLSGLDSGIGGLLLTVWPVFAALGVRELAKRRFRHRLWPAGAVPQRSGVVGHRGSEVAR